MVWNAILKRWAVGAGLAIVAGSAQAGEACLPFTPGDGGTPVIAARVNDQGPFLFILDTAASGTALDPSMVKTLAPPRDAATEQAQGMGGPMDVHFYRIASMIAGPLAMRDFTAPEIPAPQLEDQQIAGLAGVDLFGDALTIWRPRQGCVGVAPTGTLPGGGGWTPIDATWTRPWKIMLPVRIGAVDGLALLDTGAQYSVLNPTFARRLGLGAASGRLRPGGEMFGIDGRPLVLSQASVADVAIGVWRGPFAR